MEGKILELYDDKGYKHKVDPSKEIGEGGQGKVFRSAIETILVKVAKVKRSGEMKWKVKKIRSLGLPKHLKFALPLVDLKIENGIHEGYIMRIMENMTEISSLMKTSFSDKKSLFEYYDDETGGLRRRLEILKKIAYNLYTIHSRGIIYGDISPNNIFVSEDKRYSEAWFIDCDNMDYTYNVNETIGSPGFCSPEVRRALPPYNGNKQVNTIENDIYAFVNIVFYILFLADPFRGSITLEPQGEEDNWDDEEEWDDKTEADDGERKFDLGDVSWIGEGDPKNQPVFGLSVIMNKMVSRGLMELLDRTLGYQGRMIPASRPSMRLWYEEIKNLLNNLVDCECGHSYYRGNDICLRCSKAKPKLLKFEVEYEDERKKIEFLSSKESMEGSMEVKNSHLGIGRFKEKDDILFELFQSGRRRQIRNRLKKDITLIENFGLENEVRIRLVPNRKQEIRSFEGSIIDIDEKKLKIKMSR